MSGPSAPRRPASPHAATALVATAAFLGFVVQPLAGRRVLPLLGGSPAVWAASLVVFQSLYLVGQAIAVGFARFPGQRVPLLIVLVAGTVANAAVTWPDLGAPASGASPSGWLVGALLVGLGPAFVSLAATTPMVHRVVVERGVPGERAWRLVVAGSAGSLAALILYPTVLDPLVGVRTLVAAWGVAASIVVALVAASALRAPRGPRPAAASPATDTAGASRPRFGRIVAIAALASALLLAITAHATTDLAPVPLLWVLPLALYLVGSMLAFAPRAASLVRASTRLVAPLAILGGFLLLAERPEAPGMQVLAFLALSAVASAHLWGLLSRERPADPARAASWYVATGVGGALGGLGVGLLAPWCFDGPFELPWLTGFAALSAVRLPRRARTLVAGCAGAAAVLGVFLLVRRVATGDDAFALASLAAALVVAASLPLSRGAFVGALATLLALPSIALRTDFELVHRERTFFGTHVVLDVPATPDVPAHRRLVHGRTIHGAAWADPARRAEPLTYYGRGTPAAELFDDLAASNDAPRVGIVGLGIGSLAAYARERWSLTLIEIDEAVVRIARDPRLFSFLADTPAHVETIVGDGRRVLSSHAPASFDLLVVDAFSSDAVPVHLLTTEAMAVFLRTLAANGRVAFHVSSRHVDLVLVVAGAARACAAHAVVAARGGATWVAVAHDADALSGLRARGFTEATAGRAWTDDRVHLLDALR